MKMKIKQIIALVVVVALLMAGSVLVTYAYLTSQDKVENTFTIGNVKITLDEAKVNNMGEPVNDEGTVVELANAPRVDKNNYKLIPGHTYTKDPTVTVQANSEPCFVRMIVTVDKYDTLVAIYGNGFTLAHLIPINNFNDTDWEAIRDKGNGVYEIRYKSVVHAGTELAPAFTRVALIGEISDTNYEALDGMKIDVVAHAIQADGFATDAEAAWTAFDQQMETNGAGNPGQGE